jgi:hypothetical protein
MADWIFLGGIAAGASILAGRALLGRRGAAAAGAASGLVPVADLGHVSTALQRTALWSLSDGGFEARVIHGEVTRGTDDVDVTGFDLETLRERRGEWAQLPVEPPFRIAGRISVVVCQVARRFPHLVLKREGRSDALDDDDRIERAGHVAKQARDRLGLARGHVADLPATLPPGALAGLPEGWHGWGDADVMAQLLGHGGAALLLACGRRDLVIELLEDVIVIYLAGRRAEGADELADLVAAALTLSEGILAATVALAPRGVDPRVAR